MYMCVCERERERERERNCALRDLEKQEFLEVGKIARFLRASILVDKVQIGYLGIRKGV